MLTSNALSECCRAPIEVFRLNGTTWYECGNCGDVL